MQTYTYTVILEPAADGGFTAFCPSLPGVVTEGDSVEEALDMARDAIAGYLESLRKDGLPIPQERGAIISPVTVALPSAA
ncbi:MAG: type II toxin-antitoxin system HicB family antitoxin [Hyphomicrobiales bacterium]|nr:type II toxin-antitoxin system HicB family antitoxin [Hyphomicrobiales bacterium]